MAEASPRVPVGEGREGGRGHVVPWSRVDCVRFMIPSACLLLVPARAAG